LRIMGLFWFVNISEKIPFRKSWFMSINCLKYSRHHSINSLLCYRQDY